MEQFSKNPFRQLLKALTRRQKLYFTSKDYLRFSILRGALKVSKYKFENGSRTPTPSAGLDRHHPFRGRHPLQREDEDNTTT